MLGEILPIGFINHEDGMARKLPHKIVEVGHRNTGPCGVIRVSEKDQLCPWCHRLQHRIQIVGEFFERNFSDLASHCSTDTSIHDEGRVTHHDLILRSDKSSGDKLQQFITPVTKTELFRFDAEASAKRLP